MGTAGEEDLESFRLGEGVARLFLVGCITRTFGKKREKTTQEEVEITLASTQTHAPRGVGAFSRKGNANPGPVGTGPDSTTTGINKSGFHNTTSIYFVFGTDVGQSGTELAYHVCVDAYTGGAMLPTFDFTYEFPTIVSDATAKIWARVLERQGTQGAGTGTNATA